jgi:hypothetical protein
MVRGDTNLGDGEMALRYAENNLSLLSVDPLQ